MDACVGPFDHFPSFACLLGFVLSYVNFFFFFGLRAHLLCWHMHALLRSQIVRKERSRKRKRRKGKERRRRKQTTRPVYESGSLSTAHMHAWRQGGRKGCPPCDQQKEFSAAGGVAFFFLSLHFFGASSSFFISMFASRYFHVGL